MVHWLLKYDSQYSSLSCLPALGMSGWGWGSFPCCLEGKLPPQGVAVASRVPEAADCDLGKCFSVPVESRGASEKGLGLD